jgi:glycosyltransferase involved in cell wall biosynthesis
MVKTIWIDGYEANVSQRLGSGQVGYELLKNLEQIDQENDYTILVPSEPLSDLPKLRDKWQYRILKPHRLWTRIALPLALFTSKNKPDVFFSPTHYIPRFAPKSVKRVVMIFDLAYLHFKEMFKAKDLYQLNNWTKQSVENANKVITISKSSKRDIIKNYKVAEENVTISYPGHSDLYQPLEDPTQTEIIKHKYGIKGEYVLFIGTVQPRKNLKRLIEAFRKIDHVKLVVVGKIRGQGRQAWMFEEIVELPKKLGIEDRVIFTDFVPDNEIVPLTNGATAFLLPSLWEGFGIPAADAMACGVPCIVSDISSLPEVVGNAGLLVDPKSVDQIEQAIRLITTDKKLHSKLSKLSLEQAKKFSWRKMAKEVLEVIEKA